MRAKLDPVDTGFSLISATELRVKLSSRQSLQLAAGRDPATVRPLSADTDWRRLTALKLFLMRR